MSTTYKIGLLFLMYIVQKVFLCFSWALLPMILRKQGASLGTIGFTALVYSPWCLKFVYASFIDRYYSTRLGRRKSWISPLLVLSVVVLPFLSLMPPEHSLRPLIIAIFLLNWIFATTDIAVDGYATDILKPEERSWGNSAQMIGYILGYMLGAGIFLILYQQQGWRDTILIISALQLLIIVPILLHEEIPPVSFFGRSGGIASDQVNIHADALSFIAQPRTLWFFLFSTMIIIVDQGGSQLRLPMFVDMGIEPADLGRLNIWIGSPMCALGSILGGIMLNRFGAHRVFVLGCLGSSGLNFFSASLSLGLSPDLWQISTLVWAEKLMSGIIFILVFNMIMGLSIGPLSATYYAILGSIFQSAGLGIIPIIGSLCDIAGYFHVYTWLGIFGVLTLFTGEYLLRHRLNFQDLKMK